jgi:uncharacterized membrane protein
VVVKSERVDGIAVEYASDSEKAKYMMDKFGVSNVNILKKYKKFYSMRCA